MIAHSPGPWYFHNNAAGYDELRSPNGEVIAMWGEWPALTKADAELIRSAPEMLAIVRKAAEGSCGEPDGCAPRWPDDEICEHRMAIAFLKKFDEVGR